MALASTTTRARLAPQPAALTLLGAISLVLYLAIVTLGPLRGLAVLDYVPRYLALFAPYLAALWLVRSPLPRSAVWVIWTFALLFRLVLLSEPPTLSDDVYRYIWDGRVQVAGVNPYAHRVDSPALDYLTTPNRAQVNNAWMASPYLPTAQLVFALVYRLAPESPLAFQVLAVIFDLTSGALIWSTLRRLGVGPQWALLYLWNPLVVIEAGQGAHVDALMTTLLLAALWQLTASRRSWLSPVLLGLATLVKPVPLFLVPVLVWRWRWPGVAIYITTLLLGIGLYLRPEVGLGLYGPLDGTGIFGAIRIYATRWNFNGGLYHWLEVWITGFQTPGAVPPDTPGVALAKTVSGGLFVLGLVAAGRWARSARDLRQLFSRCVWPVALYLLLTTTVHPWYLMPLVALLPFALPRWSAVLPFIYYSASVGLSYLTYLDPLNLQETDWGRRLEYLPLYGLLTIGLLVRAVRSLNEVE